MAEINIFENEAGAKQVFNENKDMTFFKVTKIIQNNGIKQVIEGASFPKRGYTPPEAMFACNQSKRLFMEGVKLFSSWQFIGAVILTADKEKFLRIYNDLAWKVMSPYIVKYEFLNPMAQEIQDLTYSFLIKLDVTEVVAKQFSKVLSNLIEYDDAYNLRLLDIFSETNKEWMIKYPRREVNRLVSILSQRDYELVTRKFKSISKILSLMLLVPKYKKIFREVIEDSNFTKLQKEDMDEFWMCWREDYKFMGMSNEDRKEYLKAMGWKFPTLVKI